MAVSAVPGDGPTPAPADQAPKPTGLTEKVETRLVQLDVAVEGDRDAIRGITAKDFVLYVGEHEVQGLIVDRLCGDEPPPAAPAQSDRPAETSAPAVAPPITRPRATFVFFFDQPHLTMAGRALSLETSRDLINRLIVGGARATIVSNARRLETIVPLTDDREKLVSGLERLRRNLKQWDSYSETEPSRAGDAAPFCGLAKVFAREEYQIARQSTQRLGTTVGALAELPAPKALVYFGDNLRQKAGLHFLQLACLNDAPGEVMSAEMVPSAAAEFDALTAEAAARNVHFFTIQAEGMLVYRGTWDTNRHRHAQDTLVSLAAETGGEAFLGGASNKHIADRIDSLTSCRLLLSFPPGDLPRDKAMSVTLELHVPKVKIRTQGRIVVPSPASIENARLLAAFMDPASSDDGSLRALLIPRGGDGKTWKAAVQLRLRPSGLPDNSAELGASIVRHDTVTDHFAASIATKSPSRAMVLEKTLDLHPGEFSVVAVARDAKRDDIASSRLDADWPNPAKSEAAIAPIAVVQAGPAAMEKDGAISSSGPLARDVDETLDPSASVSLESVVCRGAKTKAPVLVERWLEDGLPNDFEPVTIAEAEGPCIRTVDVVREGRLKSGVVDYRVVCRIGDEIVAQERRSLRVGATP
jgi:VWFA-related protein